MARVMPPILFKLQQPFEMRGFAPLIPNTQDPPTFGIVWSPSTSDGNYQLSLDRLRAKTLGKNASGDALLRCTTSSSSGYFEVLVNALSASCIIGLSSTTQPSNDWLGDFNGLGYSLDGNIYRGGGSTATYSAYTTGDVIGVCRKGNFLYLSKNGVWQNSADPSAGTGGIDVSGFASDVLIPAASTNNAFLDITGRFTAASMAYPIPTGVTAWDGTTTGTTTSVSPATGNLVFTGYQPTITLTSAVSPSTGHLTFGGKVPTVTRTLALSPATGHLTFGEKTPTISVGTLVNPLVGHLTFTGYVPTITRTTAITPSTGHLSFGGKVPTVALTTNLTPSTGHLAFTGKTPSLALGITPATGHLMFTGYVPDVSGTVVASSAQPLRVQYRHRNRNG